MLKKINKILSSKIADNIEKILNKLNYIKPIKFKEANTTIAKNQPEYRTLPAWRGGRNSEVISCWKIGILNRVKLLFTGKIWMRQLTFNNLLQPQHIETDHPFHL